MRPVESMNQPADQSIALPQSLENLDRLLDFHADHWHGDWLEWLCRQLPGASAALLVTDEATSGQFHARAVWPAQQDADADLEAAASAALTRRTPLIVAHEDGRRQLGSYPVFVGRELRAVVTVLFAASDDAAMQRVLALIEFCCAWLETALGRAQLGALEERAGRQRIVIDGVSEVLGERDFEHAALRFVNLLGRRLQAERVVLGLLRHGAVRIHAQSDSSGHSARHEMMKLSAAAMQETVDQQETVVFPAREGEDVLTLAHERLAQAVGRRALMTVPLVERESCFGAVLFERPPEKPFSPAEQRVAEALVNYVGVVLEEKRQANLPLYAYAGRSLVNQLGRLLGPGYLTRKLVALILLALVAFFAYAPGQYRLAADAVLEGAELRAIVVPFDAYLEEARPRAGDRVAQGELLARLDTRELRLQRMSWISQQATSRRQYQDALARQQRAQVQISKAQMDRATAELELIDFQIAQASLKAPFDALLVSGDLSQRIGASLRQGEVLYELAPSDRFRLALYVDEYRIEDIDAGMRGQVVLAALPEREFDFQITAINPLAEVRDGATVYRVEADIDGESGPLRVGLEGVAKIDIDRRLLIQVWTRGLVDWARMQLWTLWG